MHEEQQMWHRMTSHILRVLKNSMTAGSCWFWMKFQLEWIHVWYWNGFTSDSSVFAAEVAHWTTTGLVLIGRFRSQICSFGWCRFKGRFTGINFITKSALESREPQNLTRAFTEPSQIIDQRKDNQSNDATTSQEHNKAGHGRIWREWATTVQEAEALRPEWTCGSTPRLEEAFDSLPSSTRPAFDHII